MERNHGGKNDSSVRMELKYCEHCGGLWVREGGGGVYCDKCSREDFGVADPEKEAGEGHAACGEANCD
jgi:hypothetical protein